jgi:uncharacterized protein (TIGR00730 family)
MGNSQDESERAKAFSSDAWRVFKIVSEFVDGFENMTNIGPSVSIFGSARLPPASEYYNLAIDVSQLISQRGFAIITGGGPGIMEAANKGAQTANGRSCGLSIDLATESPTNLFVDTAHNLRFRYFFVRKVMFIRYAQGFVFLPGGVGTLDELFEALTLIQTQKIHPFPIYMMGKNYWEGLIDWLRKTVLNEKCISEEDLDLLHITDDPEEVANGIERHYQRNKTERNF